LLQEIKLEHSNLVFLAGIELGIEVVNAFLSKFLNLVRGAIVNGVSVSVPGDISRDEIEVHPKDHTWIKKHLEKPDATGIDEAASMKLDNFKSTFNISYLPLIRQFRPTLVLIAQMDTARARRDFHLLAYKIKTASSTKPT